ncbi:MAG TPA: pyruvate kinase, partial [Burkholderiales bacterium]
RRTKIIATLGPASTDPKVIERMVDAGVDLVRMNYSHGKASEHAERAEYVRSLARARLRAVGVMADLQGPKIRIGKFAQGKITLKAGERFILDADCELGNHQRVGLDYKELPQDVSNDSVLLLDDGRIVLIVQQVKGSQIITKVEQGGVLSNNKGINRRGGGLSAPALTQKDMADIKAAAAMKADYLAVSFPRSGADMRWARQLFREAGGKGSLVAKIERVEAVSALDDILSESDAIMVARGDLAVEMGDAAVPALQKNMIRAARMKNKLAITATQMMESMITSPVPTRAEVSDVANAVLDGSDAVMLSAETAAGQYPVETVAAMARVCLEAEKEPLFSGDPRRVLQPPSNIEEAIARGVIFTANSLDVKAIAALTSSGNTPLLMSRLETRVPIYALSPVVETRRRVTMFRGVYPVRFSEESQDTEQVLNDAEDELLRRGAVQLGDMIVLSIGEPIGKAGGTNTMRVVRVGEHRR